MPERIQRKREPGWRKPANTVYVGRGTKWGNPLRVETWKGYTAENAAADYRRWIFRDLTVRSFDGAFGEHPTVEIIRKELRGKNLMCWCPAGRACHADVLLDVANADQT